MDLLSGNILRQRTSPRGDHTRPQCGSRDARTVAFIDYEYAIPAPATFDIANHFGKWQGLECDYTKYPTKAEQRDFLCHCLNSRRMHSFNRDVGGEEDFVNSISGLDTAIESLCEQTDHIRALPGFYWASGH